MKLKLFNAAIAAKSKLLQRGVLKHNVYDAIIFNKIKKGLGMDHIRLMISGAAPLNDNVMTFYRCMLGVPVLEGTFLTIIQLRMNHVCSLTFSNFFNEGYGQTEGSAAATISHPDDVASVGHVGGPTGVVEIALYDVPEMGYLQTDRIHRGLPCQGRGEICVRGPNVFKGYYKDIEKTRETIDDEGWLHSGDIGLWRLDGTLQIIDRKKNIFKLSQGEYVAPEKIENILIRSAFIAQCFIYGDSLKNSLVAIVVPDEEVVRNWIKAKNPSLATASMDDICNNADITSAVLNDIKDLSRESKFQGFEVVKAIRLHPTPFTIENDLMTPTFKLKRKKIRDMHEKIIASLYDGLDTPTSKL
jgi:long-chain acyl-CoA synthetase